MINGSIQSALDSCRYVTNQEGIYTQYDLFMLELEEWNYIIFNKKFLNKIVCESYDIR
jgi:hypothetical protein